MNRIKKIASFCVGSQVVCDIGCDHAYSLIYAIKEYGVKKGIAVDIAEGPLSNAKKTIEEFQLSEKITTVLSDGFTSVDEPFDTAILSGMGGILICDILKRALPKLKQKKLIIEANNDTYRIRQFLFEQGFYLVDEDALYDHKKYYEILVFEEGQKKYTDMEIIYGPILLQKRPSAFLEHYTKKVQLLQSILPSIVQEEEKKIKELQLLEISTVLKG